MHNAAAGRTWIGSAGFATTTRHHGFQIVPRPYQIDRTGLWTVDLEIHRKQQHRSFSFGIACATEQDAIERCLLLGRDIIDGHLPGYSIASLRHATRFSLRHLLLMSVLIACLSAFTYSADALPFTVAHLEIVGHWVGNAALVLGVAVLGNSAVSDR
jgi:hypothetical protein